MPKEISFDANSLKHLRFHHTPNVLLWGAQQFARPYKQVVMYFYLFIFNGLN